MKKPELRPNTNLWPRELEIIEKLLYNPCGFQVEDLQMNSESREYSACSYVLNSYKIEHRLAKITPAKTGQFVAIWRRSETGITQPYTSEDDFQFLIITVKSAEQLGQFIFPKSALIDKMIISCKAKGGKRGIRVYPPWNKVTNKQATKTQNWQLNYFLAITDKNTDNFERLVSLLQEQ